MLIFHTKKWVWLSLYTAVCIEMVQNCGCQQCRHIGVHRACVLALFAALLGMPCRVKGGGVLGYTTAHVFIPFTDNNRVVVLSFISGGSMKIGVFVALIASMGLLSASSGGQGTPSMSSAESMKLLVEGNHRYTSGAFQHPNQQAERRTEVAKGQKPFAIVLTCADSRVPPEIVFDQGLGDLFVIRVAGNIIDDAILGSIEYAAEHLGTPLLVVMGHERCGAVSAAIGSGEVEGHIGSLVRAIKPAVVKAKSMPGDIVENSVKMNVAMVVEKLQHNKPVLSHLVEQGKFKVVGAYYDLDDGSVSFLDANNTRREGEGHGGHDNHDGHGHDSHDGH